MPNKSIHTKLTKNEEDYLKALFHLLSEAGDNKVGTNQLAEYMGISPASVSGMLKKMKTKDLVASERYGKLDLTEEGTAIAVQLIRKHRLWETFLYTHMNFTWDEVHEVAEQLEHIKSTKLIAELDKFLGHPKRDPHGAVIPNAEGEYQLLPKITLAQLEAGDRCRLVSVKDSSVAFLQYVSRLGLALSSEIQIREIEAFDGSVTISFDNKEINVSKKFVDNVFVEKI
ncbi:MAG: metal-dependent transcriptional regulator [Bacteroidota bacterium]